MKYARLTTAIPRSPARLALAAALAATLLAACSAGNDGAKPAASAAAGSSAPADGGPIVATVNGQAISQKMLDALALTRGGDASNPQVREKLVKQLTDTMVLVQAAKKEGMEKDPDFAAAAELARLQGIATATSRFLQKGVQVDDAAVKAEYDQQVAKGGSVEYDFSQIVFTDQDKAAKVATEIAKGKSFDKVMEAYNKDKDNKDVRIARNYPKVRAAQLPPPMATALAAMKPNETSKTPVQLPQGFAIFNLKSSTTVPPPAFEQMKEGLRRTLARRLGEERIAKLRQEAQVTITPPPGGTAAPATPQPAPPAAAGSPPKSGS